MNKHQAHPLCAQTITVSAFITAHLNSSKYQGEVKDLLEWSATQKAKQKRRAGWSVTSIAENYSEKTHKNTGNTGTKMIKAETIVEKASSKAEKAGSSLKRRKAKVNKEKKKVNACRDSRIINQ